MKASEMFDAIAADEDAFGVIEQLLIRDSYDKGYCDALVGY